VTYIQGFEHVGSSGNSYDLFVDILVRMPVGIPTVLIEVFCNFASAFPGKFRCNIKLDAIGFLPLHYSLNVLTLDVMWSSLLTGSLNRDRK
jgi:hypothetical protein